MRFLIVLIGLLAAAVAAAGAILPRLVDAEAIRARLAAEVQAAIARPIAVRGGAELALLPRPVLSVGRVTIGSGASDGTAVLVEMDRLDLDIAPLSLLTGTVEVIGARIVRPQVRLRQESADLADLLATLLGSGPPLGSATVIDGRLTVEREGLAPEALEHIDLQLGRIQGGGLEAHGNGSWRQRPWSVELALGSLAPPADRVPIDLELNVGADGRSNRLALRGQAQLAVGAPLSSAGFDGELQIDTAELADFLAVAASVASRPPAVGRSELGPATVAGRLLRSGPLWRLDVSSATIGGGDLAGHVEIDQERPSLDVALDATRLSPTAGLLAGVAGLATGWMLPADLEGGLRVNIASLDWRGAAIRELRLTGAFSGEDSLVVERLTARLPDEGEISMHGTLDGLSGVRSWQGDVSLSLQDVRALASWLGLPEPAFAPDRLRIVTGTAGLGWSGRQARLRDLDMRVDASHITGSAALAFETRAQIAAALAIDRLPLDGYLPVGAPTESASLVAAMAQDIDTALDVEVGVLSWEAMRAERVKLRVEAEDRKLTLHELSFGDLAEASGNLVGNADLATGEVQLALDAEIARPSRLARLAGYEPPALLGRMGEVRLSGTVRRDGDHLAMEVGAATAGLTLNLEGRVPASLGAPPQLDRLTAETADFAALARQIGLPAERSLQGPAVIEATAAPRDGGIVDLAAKARIAGSLGEARVSYDGQGVRPRLTGLVGVEALDPALLQLLWDTGELTLGFPPGPPTRWPGIWPHDRLAWSWLYAADLDLAIDGLAKGRLVLDSGGLELAIDEAPLGGGRLQGTVSIDGREAPPRLAAELHLDGADAAEAVGLAGLHSGLVGRLGLDASLQAAGSDPAALVASLGGEAELRLADGAIEGIRLDRADVLESGPPEVPVRSLTGRLSIDRGIVVGGDMDLRLPDEAASLDVTLDLPVWLLEATIRRQGRAQPLRMIGPPGRIRSLQPPPTP